MLALARMVEKTNADWVQGDENEEFVDASARFPFDKSLLTCLVDRWRKETHSFHFPWGEMTPTLQDVSMLLGLPIRGEVVGPLEPPLNWRADITQRFQQAFPDCGPCEGNKHGPSFAWIQQFEVGEIYIYFYHNLTSLIAYIMLLLQISRLNWPHVALDPLRSERCLEAYIIWLLGSIMFTSAHGNTVDARYIPIAREIAGARCQRDITERSWGSAVLAYTLRALCDSVERINPGGSLLGCPLLLQLWSYERFPIGRPDVHAHISYGPEFYHDFQNNIDKPTFGSIWTRRRVSLLFSYHF